MKQLVATLISICIATTVVHAQNNILRGIVKLQSSGSQPLPDVEIASFGTNPVYSNSSGMFELRFLGKKPGDGVSLVINKDGYELINEKELEDVVIRSDADEIVIIVMSRQGERAKQALRYYDIILTNANNNYDQELRSIRSKLDALGENDEERTALYQQIEALNSEKRSLIEKAEELAKQLAVVDLDRASHMAKEAMVLFERGEIQKAIDALSDEALEQSLWEAREEKLKALERIVKADSAFQQSVENYMLKARLCISDGQHEVALKNYRVAVTTDSMHYERILEFAEFCGQIHNREEALIYFEKAVELASSLPEKVHARIALAAEQTSVYQFEDAETNLMEVLVLLQDAPEQFEPFWRLRTHALVLHDLGYTYHKWGKTGESEQQVNASIAYYDSLVLTTNLEQDILKRADVLSLRSSLYSSTRQFTEADRLGQQVLNIHEALVQQYPGKYEERLAVTSYNYALVCTYTNLSMADSLFRKAIYLSEELNKKQFQYHDVRIANSKWGLARVYYRKGEYLQAESTLRQALEMYTFLAQNKSESFIADIGRTHSMNALVKMALKKYDDAEAEFRLALEIFNQLALTRADKFNVEIARVYGNLADLYLITSRFAESEATAKNALNIFPEMESVYATLAPALLFQGKFEEALEIYRQYDDKPYAHGVPGQTWNSVFLESLDEIESRGIKHPDVERIMALLGRQ
ncbi:MAG TPA: hypothetical protein VI603_18195 [Saprospiraceae bacterium]|nr:hypothetical protein [Saprospiraceae bacterium]